MKKIKIVIFIITIVLYSLPISCQTTWFFEEISELGIKVSFPGKPEKYYDPDTKIITYFFDNGISNFIVMSSSLDNKISDDLHSEKQINSISDMLTEFNKESIISIKKDFYKSKKIVDFYYKKIIQGSTFYHRARGVEINDKVIVVLLYTYLKYDIVENDNFFNSLLFLK